MLLKDMWLSLFKPRYSFDIYFGVPGSGKTTYAAYIAKKCLKKNIPVWSNVPIKGTYRLNTQEDIGKVMISNGHIIIDEAGIEYNNRDFKNFPKEATRFYKFHRHYKTSVHVFSQGFDDMDKKLRTLATRLFVCKKSLIPFMIYRYEISKKVGVNDLTKEICDEYFKRPFSGKWIFSPVLWKLFDSYSHDVLPDKFWEKWGYDGVTQTDAQGAGS